MYDHDIREAFLNLLNDKYRDRLDVVIHEELQICNGSVRADITVTEDTFWGFEIKSEKDTLDRLPEQIIRYGEVFDYCTLICSPKYEEAAKKLLPDFWGLYIAAPEDVGIRFSVVREPRFNAYLVPYRVTQMLWRDQSLALLASKGLERGLRSKARWDIWDRIVDKIPLGEIRAAAREALSNRVEARAEQKAQNQVLKQQLLDRKRKREQEDAKWRQDFGFPQKTADI